MPTLPRWYPALFLLLLSSTAFAPPLSGQQEGDAADEPPSDTIYDSIQVQIVNLEVFVTDASGEPVTDLEREDFELFVDGREVPVSNFYAASQVRAETVREEAPGPPSPPVDPGQVEEEPPPPGADLNLVFYVDNFNLRPPDRNRVLTALERFVSRGVPSGAQMMLVTYDHSLHVRHDFTTDPQRIIDAVRDVRELSGLAPTRDARRRRAVDEIEKANDSREAMIAADSYADERHTELRLPLEALAELMEPLGGLPGRTALLHVSNGLPNRLGEDLFYLVDERFPRSGARLRSYLFDLDSAYERIVNAANAAGVTFYTLDATGLASFDSLSAAEPGSTFGGSFVIADSIAKSNLQVPLVKMADDTGGVAVTDSNNLERFFEQVARDTTSYYSLGYQAPPGSQGRYRSVRIEVDKPKVEVRHRRGFRVRSVEDRLREGVLAALRLGRSDARFPGPVRVGDPSVRPNGNYTVPLSVEIPLDAVTLVPGEDVWVGRLRLAVQARDGEGDVSPPMIGEALDVRIPAAEIERALEQHITWSVELLMRPGSHELAVGLADLVADQLEFTLGRVDVGTS